MGLPLAQAVLGGSGVAYASMFIAVFNLFNWTHGVASLRGENKADLKKALMNPGTAGLAAGLFLFGFSLRLPPILLSPLSYLSDLNTPLAMIVIGVYISRVPLRELFSSRDLYALSAMRLVLIPAACFFLMLPFRVDPAVPTAVLILSSAPTAATVFSALTMPLFAALAGAFY